MNRLEKVNDLLRDEISVILRREVDMPINCMVTVVKALSSPDLKHAKIFISVIPKDKQEEVLESLKKEIYSVQSVLNKKLVMHYVPKISFFLDHSEEKTSHIEQLLNDDENK